MATFDAHKNFAVTSIAVAPSPSISGTSLTVTAGAGALFPAAPFNCVVYPSATLPVSTNAEIVRVTSVVGDVFEIVRAQEGSSARSIIVGDVIGNVTSAKAFTDIENALNTLPQSAIQSVSAGTTVATGPMIVFSNSNNVSFGVSGSVVTASVSDGAGGAAISAGTNSQNTGTIVFSNSNGVTFGLSNDGVMTASVAPAGGGITNINFSAGTTSNNLSVLTFSNSNGVSFGLSGSVVTASHNGLTSQTVQPVAASASNGSFAFSTVSFNNANGISFGTSAGSAITASHNALTSQSVQTQSNVQGIFAGTQVGRTGDIVFSNSNGISFGMSNSSQVTASYTVPSTAGLITAINVSAGTTSNNLSVLTFSNSNGVSFGLSGSVLTASIAVGGAPGSVSAGTTSVALGQVVFSNSNNISFGLNGSTLTASATVASSQGSINFSAGTTSNNLAALTFSNSNGISFGLNGSTLTASHNAITSQSNQNITAANGGFAFQTLSFQDANGISFITTAGSAIRASHNAITGVDVFAGIDSYNLSEAGSNSISFADSNGVSFGLNGLTITASVDAAAPSPVNFSAGTTSNNLGSIVFSNSNGMVFGLNGSTITARGPMLSYYENPIGLFNTSTVGTIRQSTSMAVQIGLQNNLSFDFLRFVLLGSNLAASTTAATTGNTSFAQGYTASHNFVFYSRGSGASSASLKSYFSTQILESYSHRVSCATNSTQFSYSVRYTLPHSTGTIGLTHDYSASAASLQFSSNSITQLNSVRLVDFKIGTTLSAGDWWLVYGQSSNSTTQYTSFGNRNIVTFSMYGQSQNPLQFATFGAATNATLMPGFGIGSFTTAGGSTTASLNFSNISVSSLQWRPYIQLMVSQ